MATSAIFNYAQTFYVDPAMVGNSSVAGLTSVNLFFQSRPNYLNNISGTQAPGISLYLTETQFGLPIVNANTFLYIARAEWNNINTSSDGTQPTNFRWPVPIQVLTGQTYAFLVSYDNNEQFVPWYDRTGYVIVGTSTPSPGPSSPINGQYFEFVNSGTIDQLEAATTQSEYLSWWNPLNNVFLKFEIGAARYYINGVPVSNTVFSTNTFVGSSPITQTWQNTSNTLNLEYPANRMEAIVYNRSQSLQQAFVGAQRVWQNTVFYPGGNTNYGTLSCNMSNTITANASTSNGAAFSWNTYLGSYQGTAYIVIFDVSGVNIRQVKSIISNTQILVDEPTTFVNTASKFMIAPVATLDSFANNSPGGTNTNLLFLTGSNANATCRFTSCSIDPTQITINSGGTGYKNTDIMYVMGFESLNNKIPALPTYTVGNYWAQANLTTNTTGGITAVSFSNIGAGFVVSNNISLVFANTVNNSPSTNNSTGSGANIGLVVSSTLVTELSNNYFKACNISNIIMHYANPYWSMTNPNETNTAITLTMNYFANADLAANGGVVYYVSPNPANIQLTMNQINRFNGINQPIPAFISHSNEYVTLFVNGALQSINALSNTSNCYILNMNVSSNNDWSAPTISTIPLVEFCQYIVNDDYTLENTNYGNAYAKHLTIQFQFMGNNNVTTLSEDLRFYLVAYRPPNTDIEVFARIQNSVDNENFSAEDWTRMTLVDGANSYSSPTDITTYVNLTYGFQGQPNSAFTVTGTALISNGTATVTGSNTLFNTQLSVGQLIKVYDPLFPNNNFAICSITAIASNTSMTLDQTFSTNSALGIGFTELSGVSGLLIDSISFGHQAFNNIWNQNVVRYYNASDYIYDGFNILQMKVCLLTADQHQIPRLNSLRGIGVSS